MAAFLGKVATGLPLENAHLKMRVSWPQISLRNLRIFDCEAKPVPTFAGYALSAMHIRGAAD
jgi:hypothetical protein